LDLRHDSPALSRQTRDASGSIGPTALVRGDSDQPADCSDDGEMRCDGAALMKEAFAHTGLSLGSNNRVRGDSARNSRVEVTEIFENRFDLLAAAAVEDFGVLRGDGMEEESMEAGSQQADARRARVHAGSTMIYLHCDRCKQGCHLTVRSHCHGLSTAPAKTFRLKFSPLPSW
jgi:hypothetical protein